MVLVLVLSFFCSLSDWVKSDFNEYLWATATTYLLVVMETGVLLFGNRVIFAEFWVHKNAAELPP